MGLDWDSVLKMAAVGVLMMIALPLIFYFIFQNIGYDSLLIIGISVFVLAIIGLNLVVRRKKYIL